MVGPSNIAIQPLDPPKIGGEYAAVQCWLCHFPDLTQLDFTGPLQVLSRLPQSVTYIVAKSAAPVPSDCGLGLVPTHTFAVVRRST